MHDRLSDEIVEFIADLFPLYQRDTSHGWVAARSLLDGTIIAAHPDKDKNHDGWVVVYWQGDPERRTEVLGSAMASIAVTQLVRHQAVAVDPGTREEYARLAKEYEQATGATLFTNHR